VARALREHWPIPRRLRGLLMERLEKIVEDPGVGHREVISAGKAILSASKLNLQNVAVCVKAQEFGELEGRMDEIERAIEARGLKGQRPDHGFAPMNG
jgi:hypothetical protein